MDNLQITQFGCSKCMATYANKICIECNSVYDISLTKCPICETPNDTLSCSCGAKYKRKESGKGFELIEESNITVPTDSQAETGINLMRAGASLMIIGYMLPIAAGVLLFFFLFIAFLFGA